MTTTQFRKTFRYPVGDSDEDDTPKDLDEEEQENFIKNLQQKDDRQNEVFKRLLLALPSICAIVYLPTLIMHQVWQAKLLDFFSIISFICTAYILMSVPNVKPKIRSSKVPIPQFEPQSVPINRYISLLNGGLSVLILLVGFAIGGESGIREGFWVLCTLPFAVFLVVIVARRIMLDVDVTELEDLRYGYKGA